MHPIYEATAVPVPMSEEEREKVRQQLKRLLETHHFKNSRRYPALLRFVVEETLEGRGEYLKERLLGVKVFDRPPDYDTASDPVVRVTIAEIRKRIAQYYHDEEHDAEMRIELLPGRYAPEFRSRAERKGVVEPPSTPSQVPEATSSAPPDRSLLRRRLSRYSRLLALAVVVLFGLAMVPVVRWLLPSALDEFWGPLLGSGHAILFCIPTDAGRKRGPAGDIGPDDTTESQMPKAAPDGGPTFLAYESLGENVVYSDMLATLRIATVFSTRHRDFRVRLNVSTNLDDLRQGPAVLVGGLDNQWTLRALRPLRFRFEGSDDERYWIADREHVGFKDWSLDLKQQYGSVTRDFAIIARLHNEQTGEPQVIVAGIGMSGTAAAGEFLADSDRIAELRKRIGPQFKDHDFEAVLSTDVVNGIAGAPRILAVSVW